MSANARNARDTCVLGRAYCDVDGLLSASAEFFVILAYEFGIAVWYWVAVNGHKFFGTGTTRQFFAEALFQFDHRAIDLRPHKLPIGGL